MGKKFILILAVIFLSVPIVFAQSGAVDRTPDPGLAGQAAGQAASEAAASAGPVGTVDQATMAGRCDQIQQAQGGTGTWSRFPPCANSPAECATVTKGDLATGITAHEPINCLFLQEPIGGEEGYDLYTVTCINQGPQAGTCPYTLWYGEAITGHTIGPVQAILAYEPGREYQGPFGLLYSYLGLVYNFVSGLIIAFVILVSIIGGVVMTTSAGNQEKFNTGRSMIIKAMIGMILWFTASVILYTINPTFFAFSS